MHSLLARVTLIFFITTVAVVTALMLVVNYQVSEHFSWYLHMSGGMYRGMHGMMSHRNMMSMMGAPENEFLSSLKHSLLFAAFTMLLIGGAVSYYLARSITRPIIDLNRAVNRVAAGDLDTVVTIRQQDEVGQLAAAFNTMTANIKANTILRQRFLAGLAHELRTPLTILKANLEGIADGVIAPDQEQMVSLTEEVDRLTTMVGDLRDLSLMEAGQKLPQFAVVDIGHILRQVVNKSKPLSDEKQIEIQLIPVENLPSICADAAMIQQMVYNLLINAIKYTANGGVITVSARPGNAMLELCVSDNGIGIAAEDREHIFDYFYRVDPARTKQSGGTGLGLALVRQMALAHGGQVKVDSTLGQGSAFFILLPQKIHKKPTLSP
jgi:signal transduction histidine kinase